MGDTLSKKEIEKICEKINKLTTKLENKKSYTQSDYQKFCGEITGVLNKKVLEKLQVERKGEHGKRVGYLNSALALCNEINTENLKTAINSHKDALNKIACK